MVVGGTETTSNTVEWAMAEMLQNRRILRKVQEELDAVVGILHGGNFLRFKQPEN